MPEDLPGPTLGELRAASANLMAGHVAASIVANLYPSAFKAAADRQEYLVRAQTIGVCREDAERILNEIIEDRSRRGLSPEPAPRLAWEKICSADAYVSPEQRFVDALPADERRALVECAEEAASYGGISRQAALYALVHVMAGFDDGGNADA